MGETGKGVRCGTDPEGTHGAIDATCVILAGGESRRMGENKALMSLGNGRMLDHVFSVCRAIFPEIIIATKSPELFKGYEAITVRDRVEKSGPLGGIYTGFLAARYEYIFCVGCDMPLVSERVIRYLLQHRFDYDVVVPRLPNGLEPLHAVYSKRCIPTIERSLKRGMLAVTGFFPEVRVLYCDAADLAELDPSLASFTNINTKPELQKLVTAAKKELFWPSTSCPQGKENFRPGQDLGTYCGSAGPDIGKGNDARSPADKTVSPPPFKAN